MGLRTSGFSLRLSSQNMESTEGITCLETVEPLTQNAGNIFKSKSDKLFPFPRSSQGIFRNANNSLEKCELRGGRFHTFST